MEKQAGNRPERPVTTLPDLRGIARFCRALVRICPGYLLFILAVIGLFIVSLARADDESSRTADNAASTTESVLYYTLRGHTGENTVDDYYGDQRGTPRTGVCEVKVTPTSYRALTSRLPFYLPDTNREVETIREFPEARLWKAFEEASVSSGHSVVLYVHGYNINFLRGCRRASLFQTALDPQHRLLLFSWPSDGNLTSYTRDEADIEWSQSYLESVINRLTRIYGPGRVNIVAHSLGSRGVLRALQLISRTNGKGIINELVFLAPDIDTDVFKAVFPDIRKIARRITLYASENDNPLRLSQEVHGYPRLGEAGDNLVVMKGMDTIDVSISAGREVTGHLYHLYNNRVRADLGLLMTNNTAADDRPFLKQHIKNGLPFWLLMPETDANGR